MFQVCKKELVQFFGNPTGYLVIGVFLLLNSLVLFVFPDTNLLTYGYASLTPFFDYSPWILLFLIPAITMRSFAEEFKNGSFEILKTLPLSNTHIVLGKFLASLGIIVITLLLTLIYPITLQILSSNAGLDIGATMGSYLGLFLLCAVFAATGIFISSKTNNIIVAFVGAAFVCFILFTAFDSLSKLSFIKGNGDYFIENLGLNAHYKGLSKGAVYFKDLIYFALLTAFLLIATTKTIAKK